MNQIHYTFFKKKHYLILYFPCYVYNMLWILHNSEFTYLKYNDFLFRRLIYRRATGTLQNTRTLKKPLCKSVLFFQWYFLILRSQYLSVISGLMCLRVFHLWLVFWIQSDWLVDMVDMHGHKLPQGRIWIGALSSVACACCFQKSNPSLPALKNMSPYIFRCLKIC